MRLILTDYRVIKMLLSYAVFLGAKQLKVFPYDTAIQGDQKRAFQRAKILVSQNRIFNCECTIENFGLGGVGIIAKEPDFLTA